MGSPGGDEAETAAINIPHFLSHPSNAAAKTARRWMGCRYFLGFDSRRDRPIGRPHVMGGGSVNPGMGGKDARSGSAVVGIGLKKDKERCEKGKTRVRSGEMLCVFLLSGLYSVQRIIHATTRVWCAGNPMSSPETCAAPTMRAHRNRNPDKPSARRSLRRRRTWRCPVDH